STVTPGTPAVQRLLVRDGATAEPIAGAKVTFAVYRPGSNSAPIWSASLDTDATGMARAEPLIPDGLPEGNYTLTMTAQSPKGKSVVTKSLTSRRAYRMLVSTDKPLYQPGQLIHMRVMALQSASLKPAAKHEVLLEVEDAKANKVFKKKLTTSAYGIASADFQLADQVNTGEYRIRATMAEVVSERTVKVERYTLPRFKLVLDTERGFYAPGEQLSGSLAANYTFGEPVAGGNVEIVASEFVEAWKPFARIEGTTDGQGNLAFDLKLKDAFVGQALKQGDAVVALEAKLTDATGHTRSTTRTLTISSEPLRVEVLPEAGFVVNGISNTLYIVTAYPDGRPARTRVTLPGQEPISTNDAGLAVVTLNPSSPTVELQVTAEDDSGARTTVTRRLSTDPSLMAFLVRTDRAVYAAGETAVVSILAPNGSGPAFVDVIHDRRSVLTQSMTLKQGKGSLDLDLPPDLFGTMELHAYRILPDGNIISATRVIQVNRADGLNIEASLDKDSYRPGETARLTLAVRDAQGQPTPAALGLSGVDEAVFALQEMRPGLEHVYFNLQEEILKPRAEVHQTPPIARSELLQLGAQPDPERDKAGAALLSLAQPQGQIASVASERFAERNAHHRRQARRASREASALALLSPLFFVLLGLMAIIGYGLFRVFRASPLNLEAPERQELQGALRWAIVWWSSFLYLPLMGAIVGSIVAPWRYDRIASVGGGVAAALLIGVMLARQIHRFRSHAASEALPLLRRALTALLPLAATVVGWMALVVLVKPGRTFGAVEGVLLFLVIAFVLALILTSGALAAAGASVFGKFTTAHRGWIF
ncbi:MAG: MG2 domain-containing protein, partial [Myxococcota bacterium]